MEPGLMDADEEGQPHAARAGRPSSHADRRQGAQQPHKRLLPKRTAAQTVKSYRGMDHMGVSESSSDWDAAQEEPDDDDDTGEELEEQLADSSSAWDTAQLAADTGAKQVRGKAGFAGPSNLGPGSLAQTAHTSHPRHPHGVAASMLPAASSHDAQLPRLGIPAPPPAQRPATHRPAKKPRPVEGAAAAMHITDNSSGSSSDAAALPLAEPGKQQAAQGRKRKAAQFPCPALPDYPGIPPERLAQHHQHAQMHALRLGLGLSVDIPISAWGTLTQLRSLAAARGISPISQQQLLAYLPQPRAAPRTSKLHRHSDQQQAHPSSQPPYAPTKRKRRSRKKAWRELSAKATAQLLKRLPQDAQHNTWVELTTMSSLNTNFSTLKALHDPQGCWPPWYHCRHVLRSTLRAVLGVPLPCVDETLGQAGQKLLDAGITHMPLTCLLPFITLQYARDLDLTGVHFSNWWPPASVVQHRQQQNNAGGVGNAAAGAAAGTSVPSQPAAAGGAAADTPLAWQVAEDREALVRSGAHVIDVSDAFAYLFQIQYKQKHPGPQIGLGRRTRRTTPAAAARRTQARPQDRVGMTSGYASEDEGGDAAAASEPGWGRGLMSEPAGRQAVDESSEADDSEPGSRQPAGLLRPQFKPRSNAGLSWDQLAYYQPLLAAPENKHKRMQPAAAAEAEAGTASLQRFVQERLPVGHVLHVPLEVPQDARKRDVQGRKPAVKRKHWTVSTWSAGLPDYLIRPARPDQEEPGQEADALLRYLTARPPPAPASAKSVELAPAAASPLAAAAAVDTAVCGLRDHVRRFTPSSLLLAPLPTNQGVKLPFNSGQLPISGWELSQQLAQLRHPDTSNCLVPLHPGAAASTSEHAAVSQLPDTSWFETTAAGSLMTRQQQQQPMLLSVPLTVKQERTPRCGTCAHCTDAALSDQPCLRSAQLLRQALALTNSKNTLGHKHNPLGEAQETVEEPRGTGDETASETDRQDQSRAVTAFRSGSRRHTFHRQGRKERLEAEFNHHVSAQLQLAGQVAQVIPHKCGMHGLRGEWRAEASGAGQSVGPYIATEQVQLEGCSLTVRDAQLQHIAAANVVAQAAGLPLSSLKEASLRHCEWCAGVDHDRTLCPLHHWLQLPQEPDTVLLAAMGIEPGAGPEGVAVNPDTSDAPEQGGQHRRGTRRQQAARQEHQWLVGQDRVRLGRQALRYRCRPSASGGSQLMELQVSKQSKGGWQDVQQFRAVNHNQQPLLALQQHLTLEHRLQSAPAWLPFVPPDVVQGVADMRQAMAWMGWGTAGKEEVPAGGSGSGSRARTAGDASQSGKTTDHDMWQSPEVCLALTLLAQEHAASLLWPDQRGRE